jgi:hypothetical protein
MPKSHPVPLPKGPRPPPEKHGSGGRLIPLKERNYLERDNRPAVEATSGPAK